MDLIGFIEKRLKIPLTGSTMLEVVDELVKTQETQEGVVDCFLPLRLIGDEVLSSKQLSSEVSHLAPNSRLQMVGDSPHRLAHVKKLQVSFPPSTSSYRARCTVIEVSDAQKSTFQLSGLHPVCQGALKRAYAGVSRECYRFVQSCLR